MPSAWIDHVKKIQAKKKISYKDALKVASKSYKKGGMMRMKPDGSGVEEIPDKPSVLPTLPDDVLSKITELNTGRAEDFQRHTPKVFAERQRYTKIGNDIYEVKDLQDVINEPLNTQLRRLYDVYKNPDRHADTDDAIKEEKLLYKALGKPFPPNHEKHIRDYFYKRDLPRGFL